MQFDYSTKNPARFTSFRYFKHDHVKKTRRILFFVRIRPGIGYYRVHYSLKFNYDHDIHDEHHELYQIEH